MSKKRRRQFNQAGPSPATAPSSSNELVEEYRIIKFDLIRVLVMNAIFLAAVLTLYYTNLHSGYLERWFDRILHF
jgi:hypothetical protein